MRAMGEREISIRGKQHHSCFPSLFVCGFRGAEKKYIGGMLKERNGIGCLGHSLPWVLATRWNVVETGCWT